MMSPARWTLLLMICTTWTALAHASDRAIPRGMAVAHTCVVCHGPQGQSTGAIPSLRGMSALQLRTAMFAYRTGERAGTVMNRLARGLADEDIEAVAQYFSTLRQQ